jgi:hypothetical protein
MKSEHVHKYKRVKLGSKGYTVYKCMKPGCTHYIRQELVTGMKTICWRCEQEQIMSPKMATQAKPHCLECTHRKALTA